MYFFSCCVSSSFFPFLFRVPCPVAHTYPTVSPKRRKSKANCVNIVFNIYLTVQSSDFSCRIYDPSWRFLLQRILLIVYIFRYRYPVLVNKTVKKKKKNNIVYREQELWKRAWRGGHHPPGLKTLSFH